MRDDEYGVCLSGGGIRSAAYAMGALQALREPPGRDKSPIWDRVKCITAVSGGSYTAAANAILQTESEEGLVGDGAMAPYEVGSKEWAYLLARTDYLASGLNGKLRAFNRWLRGFLWNVVFLGSGLFIIGRGLGWLSASLGGHAARPSAIRAVGVLAVVAVVLASLPQFFRMQDARRRVWFGSADLVLLGVVAIGLVGVLIPSWGDLGGTVRGWWRGIGSWFPSAQPFAAGTMVAGLGVALWRTLIVPHRTRIADAVAGLVVPVAAIVTIGTSAFAVLPDVGQPLMLTLGDLFWVAVALGLILILGVAEVQMWSPHHFYKARLAEAFSLIRTSNGVRPRDSTDLKTYAQLAAKNLVPKPPVIICAAANVNGVGEVPTGSGSVSWTFGPNETGLSGWIGGRPAMLPVAIMEKRLGRTGPEDRTYKRREDFTYAAAMAVSGAAISPAMGRFTRRSLQALSAVLNIRLGVWYPNPLIETSSNGGRPRVINHLVREVMGLHSLRNDFLYVTDGGHYDNLGLVELLRRGCEKVFCFDAGGDRPGEYESLAAALRIARTELGIKVMELDPHKHMAVCPSENVPDQLLARVASQLTSTPWRILKSDFRMGDIIYPGGKTGQIWYARLGLVSDSPFHLLEYQRQHPPFPYHSTSQQLYDSERFEAYRQLGYFTASRVVVEASEVLRDVGH